MSVRQMLLVRGAFNLVFALYLLVGPVTGQLHGLSRGGYYALGDGLLALSLAAALFRDLGGRWLLALALVDALVRLAVGVMIVANPGMNSSILVSALFSTAVIAAFILLGIFGMVFVALGRRARNLTTTVARTGALPAFVASAWALLFGLGLILGVPGSDDRRVLVGLYAFALGLTLVLAGIAGRKSAASP